MASKTEAETPTEEAAADAQPELAVEADPEPDAPGAETDQEPKAEEVVEAEVVDDEPEDGARSEELAVRDDVSRLTSGPIATMPSVNEWNAIRAVAAEVAMTDFVPGNYKGRPEQVVAAILYGREIGIGPMQSLRDIQMIDGRPALAAHLQLALLRRGGVEILESESTSQRAVIKARRRDSGEVATVEWTFDEAEKITRKGKKLVDGDNWRNYPADMLWARCVGRLSRRLGSDLIAGMPYTAEEVRDFGDAEEAEYHQGWEPTRVEDAGRPRGAPKGWVETWGRFTAAIDDGNTEETAKAAAHWIAEAVTAKYSVDSWKDLPQAQQLEAGQMVASGVMRLEEALEKPEAPDPAFAKGYELRTIVAEAFAELLDGQVLNGPPWRLGPDEEEMPTLEEHEAKEAENLPEPEPAPVAGKPGDLGADEAIAEADAAAEAKTS